MAELTVLIPCLNEADTLAKCIHNAHEGARRCQVRGYEVLVADNGSTDGSPEIARREGARVIDVPVRGYGAALGEGIRQAIGKYIIMGDADDSYDFTQIGPFLERLRGGDQLVMGTRLRGEILPGAMPPLHRYLGNPVLTLIGNLLFRVGLSDFHCGLRGFDREAILSLELRTRGMEF
ncbi:MAG TPA: glycosyltransferase family 2 protein, partial [Anaerolineales bacterium]|nr:glycosyltransferase family 2 protein [Anaerolineales bacterium]